MTVALVAHRSTPTNVALSAVRPDVEILPPAVAVRTLTEGDVALARLDVSKRLDGIESGLWELARLSAAGVRILNAPRTLVAAHDKLVTARTLAEQGVPHPRTFHVTGPQDRSPLIPPVVVKPRFGSWGKGVVLCEDAATLRSHLAQLIDLPWFRAQGVLVQELVPPQGHDVRIVVAGGEVVGAVTRVAAPGEWRTNVALGATREPTNPSTELCQLAISAASAIEGDLVGVDLLPTPDGGHVVLELNGAVEFNEQYALTDEDVFEVTMRALEPDQVAAVA